jgi:hypothetical protein
VGGQVQQLGCADRIGVGVLVGVAAVSQLLVSCAPSRDEMKEVNNNNKLILMLAKKAREMPNVLTEADNSRGREEEGGGCQKRRDDNGGGVGKRWRASQQTIVTCKFF